MNNTTPNILLISTDQQRADHIGCYGANVVQTPNLDALAARGTRYEKSYVASPVCMPNRASLATARMPSLHGVRHNGLNLDLQSITFAELLRRAGWHTSLSGKPHFQCVTQNPALMKPAQTRDLRIEAVNASAGRYDQEVGKLWAERTNTHLDLPYYGFESVDLAVGHGDQVHGNYTEWAKAQGCSIESAAGAHNALPENNRSTIQAWRTAVPESCYPTQYVATKTIERLEHYVGSDRPFFHWMSFCDPHHPFTPPGKYWNMYQPADVDLPASFSKPRYDFAATLHLDRLEGKANQHGTSALAVSEDELRAAIALTYGMISCIDDAIGSVMRTLKSLSLDRSTIVVFLSDHGDLMGEHGLMFKGPFHYQGLIRTPLIWFDPRHPDPTVNNNLISAIDIPATFLQSAGIAAANGMHGKPFRGSKGEQLDGRQAVLIEDEVQSSLPGSEIRGRVRTLVTHEWRLSVYDGLEQGALYNLIDDPLELHNRWNDSECAALRAQMTEHLLREMLKYSETSPLPNYAA